MIDQLGAYCLKYRHIIGHIQMQVTFERGAISWEKTLCLYLGLGPPQPDDFGTAHAFLEPWCACYDGPYAGPSEVTIIGERRCWELQNGLVLKPEITTGVPFEKPLYKVDLVIETVEGEAVARLSLQFRPEACLF